MDQASKAPNNFNPKSFKFKEPSNLKNNKSLTSSKSEIHYEDCLIHFPIKVKKISCSNLDHKEDRIRGLFFYKMITENCTNYSFYTNLHL